jgi:hypothetical protein
MPSVTYAECRKQAHYASVIILNVVMLNVVAPQDYLQNMQNLNQNSKNSKYFSVLM